MKGQSSAIRLSRELRLAGETLLMGLSGGQRFAQLPNSGFESASLVLVIAVFLRQTGHLSLESLEPRDGFDDNAGACGWSNAGHKMRSFPGN